MLTAKINSRGRAEPKVQSATPVRASLGKALNSAFPKAAPPWPASMEVIKYCIY